MFGTTNSVLYSS